jgi:hypothetical protein
MANTSIGTVTDNSTTQPVFTSDFSTRMSETAEFAGGFAMFVIVKQRLCCGFTAAAEEEELADVDPRAARKAATPPRIASIEIEEENMTTRLFLFREDVLFYISRSSENKTKQIETSVRVSRVRVYRCALEQERRFDEKCEDVCALRRRGDFWIKR